MIGNLIAPTGQRARNFWNDIMTDEPLAVAQGAGLVQVCLVSDEAAPELRACLADAAVVRDGFLCARVGIGETVYQVEIPA